jgi:pimeloyl-ACP methyl ester carboxylesterase
LLRFVVAALAFVTLVIYVAYRRDLRAARYATEGSSLLITPCGPVEYVSHGEGPPVLVLHGTGGGWDQGLAVTQGLIRSGYRVIAPSRFGYLRTPLPPNADPAAEADMWACFLSALDVGRASVIGISAGAAPAMQFAMRYPDRTSSLILLVPAAGGIIPPDPELAPSPFVMKVVLQWDFPFWAAMHVLPKTMLSIVAVPASLVRRLPTQDRDSLDATIARLLPISLRKDGLLNDAATQATAQPYALERIVAPTLLLSAEDDLYGTLAAARSAATVIPNAQVIAFKEGGHLLLGHAAEMTEAVAVFMKQHSQGR